MKRIRFLTLSVVFFALIEVAYAQDLATQEESNKKLESSPRILKVIPPKPGIYSSNTAMDFEVRFDKPVYVTGKPSLPLGVGTNLREGQLMGGSGTRVLKFRAMPIAGDKALKGVRFLNGLLSDGENVLQSRTGIPANVSFDEGVLPHVIVDDLLSAKDDCNYVTEINGSLPPLVAASAAKTEVVVDRIIQTGDGLTRRALVIKSTRAPGTRAPIHEHDYGGTTTVLKGEMTLYMEGHEPMRAVAGQSYFMPAGHVMAAVNAAEQEAVMLDSYVLPPYFRHWRPLEQGFVECIYVQ